MMSRIKISPVVLYVIVILAIGFFVLGLIHLLIRCLMKQASISSVPRPSSFRDMSSSHSHALQRQLQHLFRLHDSGLDQAVIDMLPVFCYKDIIGVKEPFDCAVCLCEFSDADKLKLIPNCSHAFHIHCIETWLLSNSTCPLCRSLITCGNGGQQRSLPCPVLANRDQENAGHPARVLSVFLGKFRSTDEGIRNENPRGEPEGVSDSRIDARRCFSMGAFQYIVNDTNLQVSLTSNDNNSNSTCYKHSKDKFCNDTADGGKWISPRRRDDSFSLSKIWLWSNNSRFPSLDDTNDRAMLPTPNRSNLA